MGDSATIAYFRKLRNVPADAWRLIPMDAQHGAIFVGVFGVAFPLYLLRLGYGPGLIGQAQSFGVLVYTLAALPAGLLARHWSPRRMMILGALGECAGLALLSLAGLIPASGRVGWIMGAEALVGLGTAGWIVVLYPTLMAAAGPASRDEAFALIAAAGNLAWMVGNLLGGWLPGLAAGVSGTTLADPSPFRWTLLVGAALVLVALPPLWRCRAARPVLAAEREERHGRLPMVPTVIMCLITALVQMTGGVGMIFWAAYMDAGLKAPTALIGTVAGIAAALAIPASLAIPWVVGRWGRPGGILRLCLGQMLGLLLLAGVAHWVAAAAGQMVWAVMGISVKILSVYSLEQVDPEWRPAMNGALSLAMGIGYSSAGFFGGPIIQAWGYRGLFGLAALLALAAGLGVWAYERARSRRGGDRPLAPQGRL